MRSIALGISVLFHPLLIATYSCLLLFFGLKDSVFELMTATTVKFQITITVFIFTFVLPILNIYLMYKMNRVKSLLLSQANERTFPYIMTAIFYYGLFYLFFDLRIWETLKIFVFCGGTAILLTALINMRYKISAHMVGMGGLVGLILSLSLLLHLNLILFLIPALLVSGLVGSSRLYLQEHVPSQVYTGFLLGVFCQFILFLPLQSFILY